MHTSNALKRASARHRYARACATVIPPALALSAMLLPSTASAIPAFARKYETSCQTCHTVYPRLTPFGEAFRRNNYRFPGVDSDMTKQPVVSLGSDAYKDMFPNAVWPSWIPNSVPLSFGVNGTAVLHPDTKSSGGLADNGTAFSTQQLIAEAHLWAGGSFSDTVTFFGEVTLTSGGVDIEHARVIFNDLVGPAHAVNLQVGRGFQTLSSFGVHSSYVSDTRVLSAPVPSLYGASTDTFDVNGQYNGLELNGVLAGVVDYSFGLNAGATAAVPPFGLRPTENFYGHVGYKIGGLALDGEGGTKSDDPSEPWAETALTLDIFAAHSFTRFTNMTMMDQQDTGTTFGGGLRLQLGSLELDAGAYADNHSHAVADGSSASGIVQYDELSYIVLPWLVPAVRFEYVRVSSNDQSFVDYKVIPGVAMAIRPNIKLVVAGQIEAARGAPPGGWGPAGGIANPVAIPIVKAEVEQVTAYLAFAL
jgi:hypothetical protein